MKIPHDILVLRQFVYGIGDRSWTEIEHAHVLDLVRAILRRRSKSKPNV